MQDNLQSAIAKILGQKNETTNEVNFNNASTNAKLNYLNSKISNLETKVEVSGVPHLAEVGTFADQEEKPFYGNGYLLIISHVNAWFCVDGTWVPAALFNVQDNIFKVPFTQSLTMQSYNNNDFDSYALYLY